MARRAAYTLLILAYLASQLAAVPHAHGAGTEGTPTDHCARPHFHLSCIEPGHSKDDRDDGHRHNNESHPQPDSPESDSGHNHDSDAVYLPSGIAASSLQSSVSTSAVDLAAAFPFVIACVVMPMTQRAVDACLPGECRPGRPLYLALRALLI